MLVEIPFPRDSAVLFSTGRKRMCNIPAPALAGTGRLLAAPSFPAEAGLLEVSESLGESRSADGAPTPGARRDRSGSSVRTPESTTWEPIFGLEFHQDKL